LGQSTGGGEKSKKSYFVRGGGMLLIFTRALAMIHGKGRARLFLNQTEEEGRWGKKTFFGGLGVKSTGREEGGKKGRR